MVEYERRATIDNAVKDFKQDVSQTVEKYNIPVNFMRTKAGE